MDERARYAGRKLLFLGALLLLLTTGYECYGRLSTLIWTIKGVYSLCAETGYPFMKAWTHFEPGMFELIAYLAACALVGLVGLLLHNRARAGYFFLVAVGAMVAWGSAMLGLFDWRTILSLRNLQLIPMALIALGALINLVQYHRCAGRRKRERTEARRAQYSQAA